MKRLTWKRAALVLLGIGTAAVLVTSGAYTVLAQQAPRNDPSPVMLPDHHYDLPGTLITAAQIENRRPPLPACGAIDMQPKPSLPAKNMQLSQCRPFA